MSDAQTKPRNILGLIAIAAILGAAPLMLWLGKGRLAFAYLALSIAAGAGFFMAAIAGIVSPEPFAGIDPSTVISFPLWAVAVAGLLHALVLRPQSLHRPWYSRWYVALPSIAILGLAVTFGIRTWLYQPFNSPSESMQPNLMLGDYFFASKLAYGAGSDPQRGDIAVFYGTRDEGVVYVKRVIGLPGDTIEMRQGRLFINQTEVPRVRVDLALAVHSEQKLTFYRETLPGGASHVIGEISDVEFADNTAPATVRPGHYYVMGDNRDNAADSRFPQQLGTVPRENFIGPMTVRFWNSQGVPLVGRPISNPSTE
ncbi:MAG: signal peptidase I [Alphaproteobacteria bacterium]|nr:signal peptidase I [Alphaproteobacteria bacterium]